MTLLVAFDGSDPARRALVHAADLAGRGETIAVVNVIPVQSVSSRLETVSDDERRRQRSLLREAGAILRKRGVEMMPMSAAGDPTTEIRSAAEQVHATIIVVGGGNGARRLLHGSVRKRLLRRAPCDVLVVR